MHIFLQKAGCQIIFASLLCCCTEELRSKRWKLALKAESDFYFCSPSLSDFLQYKSLFIPNPLSQTEGEVQRKENIYHFRNRVANRRNNLVESHSDFTVKGRWTVTSLQVFPSSDVMKMLTLVLVSSAPTTPEYKEGPTLVIPIISSNKPNQRCFVGTLFLRQKGRWRLARNWFDFTFSAWNNRNVTGLTGRADRYDEGKTTAWVCTPHLMLLWCLEPSLCWQCFLKCKDSPTRAGADARNTEAERHKGHQIKKDLNWISISIVKISLCDINYVAEGSKDSLRGCTGENTNSRIEMTRYSLIAPKRWLHSKLTTD